MNWIVENWQGLLGGGSLTTIITYIVNRKSNKADFIEKMQNIYDKWVEDADKKQADFKEEVAGLKLEVADLRSHERELQKQFNEIQLAYAKEIERSQNWEKLHRELTEKYNVLEREYEELKRNHDKLQQEFNQYKKANK